MTPINLVIADDHTLFRHGLTSLLGESGEFCVLGEASSGPEAVELVRRLCPDVVLMDVHMPGGGGVEAVQALQTACPGVPVIMLTVSEADDDLVGAIRAGAQGYFLKNAEYDDLAEAIHRVAAGQPMLDATLAGVVFRQLAQPVRIAPDEARPDNPLTARESEILALVAAGHTNRQIAFQLTVSENTVKTHLRHILEKLEVASRNEAAAFAKEQGWLASSEF